MASFAIVRGRGRFLKLVNGMFLMGLAIPLQATIIPIYLMIIRLNLYDSLLAIMLPSIAFAIPLTVLILSNFIRDVPNELFESRTADRPIISGLVHARNALLLAIASAEGTGCPQNGLRSRLAHQSNL